MTGGGTVLAEFRTLDASLKEFFNNYLKNSALILKIPKLKAPNIRKYVVFFFFNFSRVEVVR